MKQRFSVWTLALRPVFLPLLLLLSAAGVAQYLLFRRALSAAVRQLESGQGLQYAFSFESLVEDGPFALILGIVFLLSALLFFFAAGDTAGGRVNDTLGRLAVPEKEIHLWWSALFALHFAAISPPFSQTVLSHILKPLAHKGSQHRLEIVSVFS